MRLAVAKVGGRTEHVTRKLKERDKKEDMNY